MTASFAIVVAADAQRGIGCQGRLPWRLAEDVAFFRRLTSEAPEGKQNAVIMGRCTFESIPARFRPLPRRINVVLSRDPSYRPEGAISAGSLEEALELLSARADLHRVFVVGGAALYREALADPRCREVYITRVHASLPCDTHLAAFEDQFRLIASDGPRRQDHLSYTFETYVRRESSAAE